MAPRDASPKRKCFTTGSTEEHREGRFPLCSSVPPVVKLLTCSLFHGLLNQRADPSDVLHKFRGKAVPLLQVFGGIVGEPHLALFVLPRECFQRKIDSDPGRGDHQRRATFWAAEDQ